MLATCMYSHNTGHPDTKLHCTVSAEQALCTVSPCHCHSTGVPHGLCHRLCAYTTCVYWVPHGLCHGLCAYTTCVLGSSWPLPRALYVHHLCIGFLMAWAMGSVHTPPVYWVPHGLCHGLCAYTTCVYWVPHGLCHGLCAYTTCVLVAEYGTPNATKIGYFVNRIVSRSPGLRRDSRDRSSIPRSIGRSIPRSIRRSIPRSIRRSIPRSIRRSIPSSFSGTIIYEGTCMAFRGQNIIVNKLRGQFFKFHGQKHYFSWSLKPRNS